ncbi:unnamed protein product [Natator depressus]
MGIQLSLKDAGDFEFVQSNVEFTACLCPDSAKTFSWDVKATKLGEVNFTITAGAIEREDVCTENMTVVLETGGKDTVIKPLLVKAEGLPEENTHSSLLCPKGKTTSETITLAVLGDVVPGSERAHISTLGDIMGTALQNIDGLPQMSAGCREQNIWCVSPPMSSSHGTWRRPEIKQKAAGFLESGALDRLNYLLS